MTDYERTTVRETKIVEPVPVDPSFPDPADPSVSVATPAVSSTVRTTDAAYVPAKPESAVTAARIVTFAFGILQSLLVLRLVLLLLIANAGNDVVGLILGVTDPFVEPFRGMFALDRVGGGQGSILDVAAVVALIGWTLVEALILAALRIFARRPGAI